MNCADMLTIKVHPGWHDRNHNQTFAPWLQACLREQPTKIRVELTWADNSPDGVSDATLFHSPELHFKWPERQEYFIRLTEAEAFKISAEDPMRLLAIYPQVLMKADRPRKRKVPKKIIRITIP